MVDASCHSSGIQNFEVPLKKIMHTYTHTHTHTTTTTTATTMKTTATAAKKF